MKTRSKDLNPKGVLKKKIIPLPKPKKALKTKGQEDLAIQDKVEVAIQDKVEDSKTIQQSEKKQEICNSTSTETSKKDSVEMISVKIQDTPMPEKERLEMRKKMLSKNFSSITHNPLSQMQNVISKANPIHSMSRNGFFDSFYAAYVFHGDVQISADVIWLTVCDRLSSFVISHKEMCRPYFVSHEGKEVLSLFIDITTPEFEGFPREDNRWDIILELFGKLIGENVKGDAASLMQNDFSSSKIVETAATNIYLMSTVKSYFAFLQICGGCGIQNVHFEGNLEDYEKLLTKMKKLQVDYPFSPEFSEYLEKVQYVVKKFIETIKSPNNVDVKFWNGIFIEGKANGLTSRGKGTKVDLYSGWMKHFFNVDIIQANQIPTFRAMVPVQCVDLIKKTEYLLTFQTEICCIEEVATNVFRPIVNIAFHKHNGSINEFG